MHRHGTMKGRWKALLFGAFWVLLGWLVARPGLAAVFAEAVPQPPQLGHALLIVTGALLVIVGLVLGLTPQVIWLLRSFYKQDFAPEAKCPVMVVCPSCREYNNRGRRRCAACTGALHGARAAGAATDAAGPVRPGTRGPPSGD